MSKPRASENPGEAELRRALELERLSCGRHVRHLDGREDEEWVEHLWYAYILPSFNDPALLGVAGIREFGADRLPLRLRAGVVILSQDSGTPTWSAVAEISKDPVGAALHSVDLMAANQQMCLDGISYDLIVDSSEFRGRLVISNPSVPCLARIAEAIRQTLRLIYEATGGEPLKQHLTMLKEYDPGWWDRLSKCAADFRRRMQQ